MIEHGLGVPNEFHQCLEKSVWGALGFGPLLINCFAQLGSIPGVQ